MKRDILTAFEEAGIGIASATVDIVGLPALRFQNGGPHRAGGRAEAARGSDAPAMLGPRAERATR